MTSEPRVSVQVVPNKYRVSLWDPKAKVWWVGWANTRYQADSLARVRAQQLGLTLADDAIEHESWKYDQKEKPMN